MLAAGARYTRARAQKVALIGLLIGAAVLLFVLTYSNRKQPTGGFGNSHNGSGVDIKNDPYAYRQSYHKYTKSSASYTIAIIADKDTASKNDKVWESELMLGKLTRDSNGAYSVSWEKSRTLTSQLNENGRAMELSELAFFDNKLYAFDDRTGVVSTIDTVQAKANPSYILMEGDGQTNKGQKTEWATVKDGIMYVGSIGKEWTNSKGELIHYNPQWIKMIDNQGRIATANWRSVYESLRAATGTSNPGYLIHEAVCWNVERRRWFFLPRRVSSDPYDDVLDEERCSNKAISLDENLQNPSILHLGPLEKTHGFSSCKFVPFREDEMVALKTMEYKGEVKSYITVLGLDGRVLMPEQYIADIKFEGVEFIQTEPVQPNRSFIQGRGRFSSPSQPAVQPTTLKRQNQLFV